MVMCKNRWLNRYTNPLITVYTYTPATHSSVRVLRGLPSHIWIITRAPPA
jgi:hypothetical protein